MEPQIDDEIISFDTLVRDAERLCERRSREALPLIERAGTYASVSENLLHLSTVKHLKAYYHSVVLNEYDECIHIITDILQALDPDELNAIGPKLFMTLGNAYQLKGDVFEAQGSYLRGIRLLEAKETRTEKERELQASYYYNMTLSLASSQLKISSVEYLDKAIEIYKELNATRLLARCYVLYSGSYEESGDLESAEQMLEQALIINKQNNDSYSIALAEANLGIINNRMGRYDRACGYLSQTLTYYQANELYFELAMVQTALGECHFKTGKYQEGLEIIEEAEKVLTAIDNKQELSKLYKTAAALLYDAGEYKKGYEYLNKHNESINSFFDIEKTNALARAKREFESEQQEKESILLRQKNEEIKKYVHKLEGSNNSLKQFAHV
ncbi:MAG: histidine kinase, partial [Bacteroidetes bacterium]|nr:histidine kinase [Bacteroidota bacterium]